MEFLIQRYERATEQYAENEYMRASLDMQSSLSVSTNQSKHAAYIAAIVSQPRPQIDHLYKVERD